MTFPVIFKSEEHYALSCLNQVKAKSFAEALQMMKAKERVKLYIRFGEEYDAMEASVIL